MALLAMGLSLRNWNWGRISSVLATNLPAVFQNRSSRAWRSKLIQIRVPAMPRLLRE
jgi:hypothetical protein